MSRSLPRFAWRAVRAGLALAAAPNPRRIAERTHVDEHWRRQELDGRAPRLRPHETIAVGRPLGRWRHVDPLVPFDGWRRPWTWAGLGLWAGVTGALGFLGWKTGRGPLGGLGHLDEFGDALPGLSSDDVDVSGWWDGDDAPWSQGASGAGGADDAAAGRWSD